MTEPDNSNIRSGRDRRVLTSRELGWVPSVDIVAAIDETVRDFRGLRDDESPVDPDEPATNAR